MLQDFDKNVQAEQIYARRCARAARQKRLRLRRCWIAIAVSVVLAAAAVFIPLRTCSKSTPSPPANPEIPSWITQNLLSLNPYSRPGTALTAVKGIVVHYVGNPGTTAIQNRDYFEGLKDSGETSVSSHFIIGLAGEIIQCVPLSEIAYCSNERNVDTVSIECCHEDEGGQFNSATYSSLVRLVTWLCSVYSLDSGDVIRHYDVTGKLCPIYYVQHPDAWDQFLSDVDDALKNSSA